MSRVPTIAGLAACVLVLAACSSSTGGSATLPPSPSLAASAAAPTVAASPSAAPSGSLAASPSPAASSGATAVPTSIDPCQLVTAQEASQLAGGSFGAGKEETTPGSGRICSYGSTGNTFSVIVGVAPDVSTAKSEEQTAEAKFQASAAKLAGSGVTVTQLPNFAGAADAFLLDLTVKLGGKTIGGTAIYVLKGTTFFGFSDIALDKAPPTTDAMKAEAMTVLGRLP